MSRKSYGDKKRYSNPVHVEVKKKLADIAKFKGNLISGCHRHIPDGSVYNNHTIYLRTLSCTVTQIHQSIQKSIESFVEVHPDIYPEFTLNVVMQNDGSYTGRTFVHFRDPRIYNALIGYTLDGKENVKETDDPDWTPPVRKERTGSWADEEEEEPRKIKVEAERLLMLAPITDLTEEQKVGGKNIMFLQAVPAHITPGVGEGFSPNVLRLKPVTSIFGEQSLDHLMKIFAKYADTQTASRKYPDIKIFPKSDSALIIFGSHEDAQFARLMSAKIYIKNKDDSTSVIKCYSARDMNYRPVGYTGSDENEKS